MLSFHKKCLFLNTKHELNITQMKKRIFLAVLSVMFHLPNHAQDRPYGKTFAQIIGEQGLESDHTEDTR